MKPVTITMPEELDAQAAAEARRLGISKSELIRRGLAEVLPRESSGEDDDPWMLMTGFGPPGVSVEPGEIDDIVYGDGCAATTSGPTPSWTPPASR